MSLLEGFCACARLKTLLGSKGRGGKYYLQDLGKLLLLGGGPFLLVMGFIHVTMTHLKEPTVQYLRADSIKFDLYSTHVLKISDAIIVDQLTQRNNYEFLCRYLLDQPWQNLFIFFSPLAFEILICKKEFLSVFNTRTPALCKDTKVCLYVRAVPDIRNTGFPVPDITNSGYPVLIRIR